MFGGLAGGGEAVGLDRVLVGLEHRRKLAGMGQQHRRGRAASAVPGKRGQGVQGAGVEGDGATAGEHRLADHGGNLAFPHPGPRHHRVDIRGVTGNVAKAGSRTVAGPAFRQRDDQQLRHLHRDPGSGPGDGRNLDLAGAGTKRRSRGQDRRSGHLAVAGDNQEPAVSVLAAVRLARQREGTKSGSGQVRGALHRDPTTASGAAVLAAPSASSGAPWFHKLSLGTHKPCASGSKS